MDQKAWKRKIVRYCKAAGTYEKHFDAVIETLAEMLERRDELQEILREDPELVVERTNKFGATNKEQSPVVRMLNDLNRDALVYWRDLGLTPAGLKRIKDKSIKVEGAAKGFEEILAEIGA